jgi:hypothetical protein
METNNQYKLTVDNWKSIYKGALINLAGTVLLTIGLFLQSGKFSGEDFRFIGVALLANLGAVIVNTVRKFITVE